MSYEEIGTTEKAVFKTYEEIHIEWSIPDFFKIADTATVYSSPASIVNYASWSLKLCPKPSMNWEFMRLFIETNMKREYTLECHFSLKKSDGSAQHLACGILEGNEKFSDTWDLVKMSELLEKKSELVPDNVLTIICIMKRETHNSSQQISSNKAVPMKLIRLDTLSENFKDLFGDKETSDTTLYVKDKEYKAHRTVLIARSNVFAATFKHDTLERQTGVITISDCDPGSFEMFLEFLYSGKLEEISSRSALNLYYTSDKYNVEELKLFCVEYLMQNLTVENICQIAAFADTYDETALFSAVQDFFNRNVRKILLTSEWVCFLRKDNRLANKLLIDMANIKLKD